MTDLTISATVTRTELSLGDLQLNDGTNFTLTRDGFTPGSKSFRKETVDSPLVAGRYLLHAVADVVVSELKIRCSSTTDAGLAANVTAVVNAFSQFQYTVTVTINGVAWQYLCECADTIAVGDSGAFQSLYWFNKVQEVGVSFSRHPTALMGPM